MAARIVVNLCYLLAMVARAWFILRPMEPERQPESTRGPLGRWLDDPLTRLVLVLVLATAVSCLLVALRAAYSGRATYNFLYWNLFLACIPVAAAYGTIVVWRRTKRRWLAALAAVIWLAFFPNAPYIITDLMHLRSTRGAPLWMDLLMVSTSAWTGLLLGLGSLALMHRLWLDSGRSARWGWFLTAVASVAAGFGVYLGRFLRWNSWDLVTRPVDLLHEAFVHFGGPRIFAFSLAFGLVMWVAYLALHGIARPFARSNWTASDGTSREP
ncbi:MAG: putative membrane protein [Myxococcota bacterium]|jgi:uncharacterized membrane protein